MKTLYRNGILYVQGRPQAGSFVVAEGRFAFVGSDEAAAAFAGPQAPAVDLAGRFVTPGFNDSHMHLLSLGSSLLSAPLDRHTGSLEDLVDCLTAHAAARPGDDTAWIRGRGWNQDFFADVRRMPDRHDLDRVSRERPVCAVRACGHCLVVNSRGLELLGVTGHTPQPAGGRIGLGADGQPDGRFFDAAMDRVYAAMAAPSLEAVKDMLRAAARTLNRYGITSCQTDDYCVFAALPWAVVNRAYRELEQAGELTVRVYEQCNFKDLSAFAQFVAAGNVTGTGTDLFRIGPLKLLGDGALGPRTAFLSRPYADEPGTRGIPVFSQETLDEMIGFAHRHGMQAAVHAIGDGCLDRVLTAFAHAQQAFPRPDARHGVVHCQITRPDQLERIRRLGLHVYAQSIFLDYDIGIVTDRVGPELAASSYAWKTLLDRGVSVSNGSDCPVEQPDVLLGIQCAVTRRSVRRPGPAYRPEEAFSVAQALDSFTRAGAFASFDEDRKGQLAPGQLADFTVLGEDPFAVPAERLSRVPVLATYLGGRQVFGREDGV